MVLDPVSFASVLNHIGYSDPGSSDDVGDSMGCLSDATECAGSVVSMPQAVCVEVLAEMQAERETAPSLLSSPLSSWCVSAFVCNFTAAQACIVTALATQC